MYYPVIPAKYIHYSSDKLNYKENSTDLRYSFK